MTHKRKTVLNALIILIILIALFFKCLKAICNYYLLVVNKLKLISNVIYYELNLIRIIQLLFIPQYDIYYCIVLYLLYTTYMYVL